MSGAWHTVVALMTGLSFALGSAAGAAHEFWVEPSKFSLDPGGRVGIRLCVADGYEGWSLPREGRRIDAFYARGPAGARPVVGLEGSDPAGAVRLTEPGGYVVWYRSNPALTVVPAAEFDLYVREKGLERILAARGPQSASHESVREAYSRHAKALIRVGDAAAGVFDRATGLRLELVAESSLSRADAATSRSFRLLHEGKPLAGALVTAFRPGTGDDELKTRTGADGRARFLLQAPGLWRIAVVHLVNARGNVAADWESLWASLTFELSPVASPQAPGAPNARHAACRNRVLADATRVRS